MTVVMSLTSACSYISPTGSPVRAIRRERPNYLIPLVGGCRQEYRQGRRVARCPPPGPSGEFGLQGQAGQVGAAAAAGLIHVDPVGFGKGVIHVARTACGQQGRDRHRCGATPRLRPTSVTRMSIAARREISGTVEPDSQPGAVVVLQGRHAVAELPFWRSSLSRGHGVGQLVHVYSTATRRPRCGRWHSAGPIPARWCGRRYWRTRDGCCRLRGRPRRCRFSNRRWIPTRRVAPSATRPGYAACCAPGESGRLAGGPRSAPEWPELTESEFAVVSLVARGATNREVAERLYLSPYTVNSHLRHVFAKLGIRSRVELARLAAEHETPAKPSDFADARMMG